MEDNQKKLENALNILHIAHKRICSDKDVICSKSVLVDVKSSTKVRYPMLSEVILTINSAFKDAVSEIQSTFEETEEMYFDFTVDLLPTREIIRDNVSTPIFFENIEIHATYRATSKNNLLESSELRKFISSSPMIKNINERFSLQKDSKEVLSEHAKPLQTERTFNLRRSIMQGFLIVNNEDQDSSDRKNKQKADSDANLKQQVAKQSEIDEDLALEIEKSLNSKEFMERAKIADDSLRKIVSKLISNKNASSVFQQIVENTHVVVKSKAMQRIARDFCIILEDSKKNILDKRFKTLSIKLFADIIRNSNKAILTMNGALEYSEQLICDINKIISSDEFMKLIPSQS